MISKLVWLSAFLGALLGAALGPQAVAASASAPVSAPANADSHFNRGMLWRIQPKRGTPSYLFGTLHSDDPRVLALPTPVVTALEQAKSVTLELLLDSATYEALTESMFYRDGRTLRATIGEELFSEALAAIRGQDLPTDTLDTYKPWTIFLALHASQSTSLDRTLYLVATNAGKPVYGLETAHEQIDIFDQLSLADQIALLRDGLREHAKQQTRREELTLAYLARDLAAITGFIDKYRPADPRVYKIYTNRLLFDRNRRMTERMRVRLQEGNAFIAIGAAHLGGNNGVLRLLERNGYRVTPIY